MAKGFERELITSQLWHGASIFECEWQAVYSSGNFRLDAKGKHFFTESIGDMHCEYGGPFNLALNSDIFLKAWKKVFSDGLYWKADLTVKVDPDAVFLPVRLKEVLRKADPEAEVYFNNCDHGLHGPIEALTRGGMKVFNKGVVKCEKDLQKEFSSWGEDVFLRHCFGILKVDRVDEFDLLSEDHCFHEDPVRDGCSSGKASFHPFKNVSSYYKCLNEAKMQLH